MTATDLDPLSAAVDGWAVRLHRTGLADSSKRAYEGQVRAFADWLAGQDKHDPADLLTDRHVRDYAVRDYRRYLLAEKNAAPKTVNSALTAISNLFTMLGLEKPDVPMAVNSREQHAPKALSEDQTRDVMRAAERRGPRDLAIAATLVGTGLRVSELAALDLDDVWVTERKGEVHVRAGKGDRPRTVPMNPQTQNATRRWLAHRPSWTNADSESALFLAREGQRLAPRSVHHAVQQIGRAAGVPALAPHVLRHTFGTLLTRAGVDVVLIAELMGHADINTTRIYSRPTREAMDSAVDLIHIDY
ncbi:tyrosine-type recombinase/integrase [Actinopolymorpha sp. B17G11]|uniref:tyrosine-type recombinase/integrase n=1 Tax=Actinopolymorpha sp. B17G11 TaxID=3160861 RepID=UPI0032E3E156